PYSLASARPFARGTRAERECSPASERPEGRRRVPRRRVSERVVMDFEFSDEQEQLRASVAAFLEAQAPLTWLRARYGSPSTATDDVWRGLSDLGVTGLLVPEALGGAGAGMVD